jgi:hypothetical protein
MPSLVLAVDVVGWFVLLLLWFRAKRSPIAGRLSPSWMLALTGLSLVVVIGVVTHWRSLADIDDASRTSSTFLVISYAWFVCFLLAGVLGLAGMAAALFGGGRSRIAGGAWSIILLWLFIVDAFLAVNSFH